MDFPDQPCLRCAVMVPVARARAVTDDDGKLLGFEHRGACPTLERGPGSDQPVPPVGSSPDPRSRRRSAMAAEEWQDERDADRALEHEDEYRSGRRLEDPRGH